MTTNNKESKSKSKKPSQEDNLSLAMEGSTENIDDNTDVDSHPGITLKKAREANGQTIHDVANSLYLPSVFIKHIEEGKYDKLPSPVFARGYLRSYADLFKIDKQDIVSAFTKYVGNDDVAQSSINENLADISTQKAKGIEHQNKKPFIVYAIIAVVLVIAIVVLYVFSAQPATDVVTENTDVEKNDSASTDTKDIAVSNNKTTPNVKEVNSATKTAEMEDFVTKKDSSTNADKDTVTSTKKINLVMKFTNRSWVEISTDNNLSYLFSGYKEAYSTLNLSSDKKLNVVLGNADSVAISVNGTSFPISKYIQKTTKVARFSVSYSDDLN